MAKTADYGFGDFAFPRGWFMVAGADEVADRPVPVRYFGEDMVLYRGESGTAHLVSAYCPHMGAHLARNATSYIIRDGQQIEGESIRCPFHGWQFGPDGRCTAIPYSDFVPGAARLKTWPVVERAGIIWMWHDPEGQEPDYPLPDFDGHYDQPGWVNWKIDLLGDLDIHGCEIVDNMADLGHMTPIHGAQECIYFANRFGLRVAGELEPKPGIPPTASHLAEVIATMQADRIGLIMQEPFYSRKAADRVAAATGARVVVVANSVGGQPEATDYLALMDLIVERTTGK